MFSKLATALAIGLPLVQATVPSISGFQTVWSDDFLGLEGAAPDLSKWQIDQGTQYPGGPANWGTGEIQTYTSRPQNLRLDGQGNLVIQARKDCHGNWTSARIETKEASFLAPAGKKMIIQARLNLPEVAQPLGYWAAFWTLGADYKGNFQNWPSVGEFDIMESVNGANRAYGVLHCDTNPGGTCDEPNGLGANLECPGSSCQGNWHVYSIQVDRTADVETLKWFVDGQEFHSISSANIPAAVWSQTVHKPHFILLNLAMGGGFPNGVSGMQTPTATTTSGGKYLADYVAVYYSKSI